MRKGKILFCIASLSLAVCMAVGLSACTVTVHEHTWEETSTSATCDKEGETTFTCTECGATETVPAAATGHSYCAESTTATCTEKGKITYTCSKCGDSYDEATDALGHSYTATSTSATCTAKGKITYTCSRCGDSYEEETDALGHNYEVTSSTVTCTAAGTVTYTCSRCGDTHTDTVAEALGHDWAEDVDNETATCTEAGTLVYKCSRCNETYTETVNQPLGHDYVFEDKDIPCSGTVSIKGVCSRCGDETSITTDGTGHNYVLKSTIEATCTESGYETYACTRCSEGTLLHSYTVVTGEAKGHTWSDWSVTDTAEDGTVTKTRTCSACNKEEVEYVTGSGEKQTILSVWDGETLDYSAVLEALESESDDNNKTITISTAEELAGFASFVDGNYISQKSLDTTLADYTITIADNVNIDLDNKNWTPIGNENGTSIKFSGTFDGNGSTIYNLKCVESDGEIAGLFGYICNATIKNVTIENAEVSAAAAVGVIVGSADDAYANDSTISNCIVKGDIKVSGGAEVGGILGLGVGTTITACSVEASDGSYIKGEYYDSTNDGGTVGGIVGSIMIGKNDTSTSRISDVAVKKISISGSYNVGGIVGMVFDARSSTTYSYPITSEDTVNSSTGNVIENCTISLIPYTGSNSNDLSGNQSIGAVIGVSMYGATIEYVTVTNVTVEYYKTASVNSTDTSDSAAGYYGYAVMGSILSTYAINVSNCSGSVTLTQISDSVSA